MKLLNILLKIPAAEMMGKRISEDLISQFIQKEQKHDKRIFTPFQIMILISLILMGKGWSDFHLAGIFMASFLVFILVISRYLTYGIFIYTNGLLVGRFWGMRSNRSIPYGFLPFTNIRRIHFSIDDELKARILKHFNIPLQPNHEEWVEKCIIIELENGDFETISRSLFDSESNVKDLLSSYVQVKG